MTETSWGDYRHESTRDETRKVWLTFDDGPHPQHTVTILDALKAEGIVATFFVVGQNVTTAGKKLLRRARGEGHCIGNHSFSHRNMESLSEQEVRSEILSTEALIADLLDPVKIFRPPFLASNAMIDRIVAELGYLKILMNVDTLDWDPAYQPDRWVQHGVEQIRQQEKSVVMAHDDRDTTAAHVSDFLHGILGIGRTTFRRCGPVLRPRP